MKTKLEQLDREREEIVRRLGEIDAEMVYKDYGLYIFIIINQSFECLNECTCTSA